MHNRGGFIRLCNAAREAVRHRREQLGYYKGVPPAGTEIEVRGSRTGPWLRCVIEERDNQRKQFRVRLLSCPAEPPSYFRPLWFSYFNSRWMEPDPVSQWRWPGQDMHGMPYDCPD